MSSWVGSIKQYATSALEGLNNKIKRLATANTELRDELMKDFRDVEKKITGLETQLYDSLFGSVIMEFEENCEKELSESGRRECLEQNIEAYADRPDVVDAINQVFVLRNKAMGRETVVETNQETRVLFLIELMCGESVSYTTYPDKIDRVAGEDEKIRKTLEKALRKKCGEMVSAILDTDDVKPAKTFATRDIKKTDRGYDIGRSVRHYEVDGYPVEEPIPLTATETRKNSERIASLLHVKSPSYRAATAKRVHNKIKKLSKAAASEAIRKAIGIQRAIRTMEKKMENNAPKLMETVGPDNEPPEQPGRSQSRTHSPGQKSKKLRIRGGKRTRCRANK